MEAKEPIIEYELRPTQIEELRSKLIAAIENITDIQLLKKFEYLISATHTEPKAKELYRSSEYIDSLIIKNGEKVPSDVNSIESLLEEKYKQ